MTNLTTENVHDLFMNCLFADGEDTDDHVIARAVMMNIGFHPERLKNNTEKIVEILNDLPDTFKKNGGGGMSFLNMCEDKNGNQWTGAHKTMDELIALGIASGKMSYLMPREEWHMFPGGMPYLVVDCE